MKQLKNLYSIIFLLNLYSCASTSYYKEVSTTSDFKAEKEILKKNLNGKFPCSETRLNHFLWGTKTPDKECLYLDNGGVEAGTTIGSQVNVLQTLPEGFILQLSFQSCTKYSCVTKTAPNLIFLHRSNEKDELVDNKYPSEFYPWDFYHYVGPYTYQSNLGLKTIYSFRRISSEIIQDYQKDFKKYNVWMEVLNDTGAWKDLSKAEEKFKSK